jgi:large subunit ribosomal protein L21
MIQFFRYAWTGSSATPFSDFIYFKIMDFKIEQFFYTYGGVKMYAVIKTGGKQYKVAVGEVLKVEKLNAEVNESVELTEVLLVSNNGEISIGTPIVNGAKVVATVVAQVKGDKVVNFKYKPKTGYHRKKGHRQLLTEIKIESING